MEGHHQERTVYFRLNTKAKLTTNVHGMRMVLGAQLWLIEMEIMLVVKENGVTVLLDVQFHPVR